MAGLPLGERLPEIRTAVPGPRSIELTAQLRRVESRNITAFGPAGPVFWAEAAGANVRDVDDNVYVDLTAGFGVSAAGHGNPAVGDAVERQFRRLAHAMGDVHPADVKVALLERLAELSPGDLSVAILSANGSDAVESALKTAVMATGRAGVVAFEGGYHGLGYGALGVTSGGRFRAPFEGQLFDGVRFVPFPAPPVTADESLAALRRAVAEARDGPHPVGAVIVEPVQGRAGIRVPPDDFLPALRQLCSDEGALLILDEVHTGFGRTGRWFAAEHWAVIPDLLVLGKALAGGLPLSAVVGTSEIMDAWPASEGEAIHTSTFLGNPVTCAAALAHLDVIEARGLVDRARELGEWLGAELDGVVARHPAAASSRGLGLMRALELEGGPDTAARIATAVLNQGIIILPEGPALAFTPPLTITREQLGHAVAALEARIAAEGTV